MIGEASYASLPSLPGCALSAHAVAAALRGLGFAVDEQDDGSSGALYAAIGTLTRQLTTAPQVPAFVYFCGYATSYEDRPFVLPVSASISRPADALTQGLLAKTLLDAASGSKSVSGVFALDAVPMPNGPVVLPLDALTQPGLPPTLGYIAVSTSTPGNTPSPMAAALVPLLHGPTVETARLLSDTEQQLAGLKTARVAALHLPDTARYLAGAPESPSPASSQAAVAPTIVAPGTRVPESMPDEQQMTDAQRRLLQRALAHLGYYDAQADGVFGTETRAAMLGAFLLGLALLVAFSWQVARQDARRQVEQEAAIMLEQATAVRQYTESQIAPLLADQNQQRFLPQTIPFYAAETTMRALGEKFPDYLYKEAALNPTNPADKATDWEAGMIDEFRRDPTLTSFSITRDSPNGPMLSIARPVRITDKDC